MTDPEDIETPITELREEVENLLDQEGEVEVWFQYEYSRLRILFVTDPIRVIVYHW